MDDPALRWCGRCRTHKPLTEFDPRTKGGWQGYCRPCHAEYKQENYRKNRAKFIARALAYKAKLQTTLREAKAGPCADCGKRYPPYVMDFDHRPGETKLFNLGSLTARRWVSLSMLRAEIEKCDLVCANCHRERTHQRRIRKGVTGRPIVRGAGGRAANGTRL